MGQTEKVKYRVLRDINILLVTLVRGILMDKGTSIRTNSVDVGAAVIRKYVERKSYGVVEVIVQLQAPAPHAAPMLRGLNDPLAEAVYKALERKGLVKGYDDERGIEHEVAYIRDRFGENQHLQVHLKKIDKNKFVDDTADELKERAIWLVSTILPDLEIQVAERIKEFQPD